MSLTHELVTEYWRRRLHSHDGEAARRYLGAIGLDTDAAHRAGIGLARAGDELLREGLIASGLTGELQLCRLSGLVVWGHALPGERPAFLPLALALYRKVGVA